MSKANAKERSVPISAPAFEMHDDPRFQDLLRRMNLEP